MAEDMRDIFICHASEDKPVIVSQLIEAFDKAKITYWYDQADIELGDSIPMEINKGLAISRYVLVILSPAFLKKSYAHAELMNALHQQESTGVTKVLPVLVGSEEERKQILAKFQLLTSRSYLLWDNDPHKVAAQILRRLSNDSKPVSRVCFISSEYPPKVFGGLGVHVKQLTSALSDNLNVDIVLASSGKFKYHVYPRIQLHTLTNNPTYNDTISWFHFAEHAADRIISRIAKDYPPDVIHCHDWVTILAGIKCRSQLNIPLVFHLHLPNRKPVCAKIEDLGLVCADLVTVNSDAMYQELTNRHLPIKWREVIKNGVDTNEFFPSAEWPEDDKYILFVGRLVEQKGVEYLLRAFYYLKEKFSDIRLKIVGDGELRPILERLCTNLMLSDKVDFLGWRTGQDLVKCYQKARVVVIPSIYEPFGMTALEALACKRPVVASRVGGLQEIIEHDVNGFLADPKDDLDLAQWIMKLLSDSDLRNKMGETGRTHISEKGYTWPRIAEQFIQMYGLLLNKPLEKDLPAEAAVIRYHIGEAAKSINPPLDDAVLGSVFNVLRNLF